MNTVITSRLSGLGELTLPGAGIGAATGLFAGLVALSAGLPVGLAVVHFLALGIPMALFGGIYTVLCARGIARVGTFIPIAILFLVGFPLSRIIQQASAGIYVTGSPDLGEPLWSFAAYNALLSTGLAFGFLWLHDKVLPWWLSRIRAHNPHAEVLMDSYKEYAAAMYAQKQRREARRKALRDARRKKP